MRRTFRNASSSPDNVSASSDLFQVESTVHLGHDRRGFYLDGRRRRAQARQRSALRRVRKPAVTRGGIARLTSSFGGWWESLPVQPDPSALSLSPPMPSSRLQVPTKGDLRECRARAIRLRDCDRQSRNRRTSTSIPSAARSEDEFPALLRRSGSAPSSYQFLE